jgi:chromosome segregation ATPase
LSAAIKDLSERECSLRSKISELKENGYLSSKIRHLSERVSLIENDYDDLEGCIPDIVEKIDDIDERVDSIKRDWDNLDERVLKLDERVDNLDDKIDDMDYDDSISDRLDELENDYSDLDSRVYDLENDEDDDEVDKGNMNLYELINSAEERLEVIENQIGNINSEDLADEVIDLQTKIKNISSSSQIEVLTAVMDELKRLRDVFVSLQF